MLVIFWPTRQINVLSRDTEAQLRQKPTFIDESAAHAERRGKKTKTKQNSLTSCVFSYKDSE